MVDKAALGKVNRKLAKAGLSIAFVPLDQCELAERNARYMKAEQFQQLVHNVRQDGQLTSVPFAVKQGKKYLILSGNHRVQAAREAGLSEVLVLYTTARLNRQERTAIQLSHNAIVGQDDMTILRELYDEIGDIALREYSGLDDLALGNMQPPSLDPLSEEGLGYRAVTIAFLPEEAERIEGVLEVILRRTAGDKTWLNRFGEYDRFLDAITAAKEKAGVKNTATAFGFLLDLVERHLDELPGPPAKKK